MEAILFIAVYAYFSYGIQTIANKTGTENAWLAWIPLANVYLLCKVADKPGWWLVLFLIPLVNIVVSVIVWLVVAEKRGKGGVWGVLRAHRSSRFTLTR